jgi:hypothetical protein
MRRPPQASASRHFRHYTGTRRRNGLTYISSWASRAARLAAGAGYSRQKSSDKPHLHSRRMRFAKRIIWFGRLLPPRRSARSSGFHFRAFAGPAGYMPNRSEAWSRSFIHCKRMTYLGHSQLRYFVCSQALSQIALRPPRWNAARSAITSCATAVQNLGSRRRRTSRHQTPTVWRRMKAIMSASAWRVASLSGVLVMKVCFSPG